ncbi:hypothetical protein HFO39_24260 [Rhizobium leguminosarum]|nr:hypothetical protein [Rhizobium leguminosarum]
MSSIARYDGEYDPAVVVSGAIGPYAAVCGGTVGNGASGNGYVTGLKLTVGITSAAGLDEGTCRIASGDRCRIAGTYMGQTKLLIATSYTGLDGVIWGLDIVGLSTTSRIATGRSLQIRAGLDLVGIRIGGPGRPEHWLESSTKWGHVWRCTNQGYRRAGIASATASLRAARTTTCATAGSSPGQRHSMSPRAIMAARSPVART